MKPSRCRSARLFLAALICLSVTGCSNLHFRPSTGSDHSYTIYWPPPKGSTKLRLAVKDLIDVKDVVTTAGSEYFAKHHPPAKRDADCLAIARERGVLIVGKTNLSEFAVAPSGLNGYFGTPKNPVTKWRFRIPGGSSSGSAVAVANNTADVAFGTDTTGSIRLPAACCGVVGLKTTFGSISEKGIYSIDPMRMDTVGPLARDVEHAAIGMDLLQRGFMERYHAAMAAHPNAQRIRVGRVRLKGTNPKIDEAIDAALQKTGFQVVELGDGFARKWEQAKKDADAVAAVWAWFSDRKYTSTPEVNTRTKAVVALGQLVYQTNYAKARAGRPAWKAELTRALNNIDFIALPTMQTLPPRTPLLGGTPLFEAHVLGLENTSPANWAGNPALALPVPVHDRDVHVTSLQLVGRPLAEAELLNAGRLVELAGHNEDRP